MKTVVVLLLLIVVLVQQSTAHADDKPAKIHHGNGVYTSHFHVSGGAIPAVIADAIADVAPTSVVVTSSKPASIRIVGNLEVVPQTTYHKVTKFVKRVEKKRKQKKVKKTVYKPVKVIKPRVLKSKQLLPAKILEAAPKKIEMVTIPVSASAVAATALPSIAKTLKSFRNAVFKSLVKDTKANKSADRVKQLKTENRMLRAEINALKSAQRVKQIKAFAAALPKVLGYKPTKSFFRPAFKPESATTNTSAALQQSKSDLLKLVALAKK